MGLRRILGSLEADLLEAVWRLAPGTVTTPQGWTTIAAVCASLNPIFHYKTAQTVMNRLVEKQLLVRRERQRAYEYRAALTREELISQVTRTVVGGLIHDFGDVAVAQLTQTLYETRPDLLVQLEQLAATDRVRPTEPTSAQAPLPTTPMVGNAPVADGVPNERAGHSPKGRKE